MAISIITIAFALLLASGLLFIRGHWTSSLPGPPRNLILGNIFPRGAKVWELFAEYSKKYGPVFSIRILAVRIVVLNSAAAARDFLEARSGTYSGRTAPKMAELAGMYEGILFQPNPVRLRQGRKFLASGLQPSALKTYHPIIHKQVVMFLKRLLTRPADVLSTIPALPTGVALEVTYGYHAQDEHDPFVQRARLSVERFVEATALSLKDGYAVNWLPFLAYLPDFLPGMSFKKTAAEWEKSAWANAAEGYNLVKENMANGTAQPSLLQKALEGHSGVYDDVVLMRTASQVYSGGSDTTTSALKTFILAMTLNPEVQAKAQFEIDQHIAGKGAGRLPTYSSDRNDLPYVLALVREVMRWHGPAPLTSRTATEDNVYEGFLIPKGTMVFFNMWAILHDQEVFPDHESFRPERWLDGTLLEKYDVDPLDIAFGFGRRVCPGKYLAVDLLFTTVASMLAVFTIQKAKDDEGREIIPKEEYSTRAIIAPLPFPCVVTPRSEASKELLDNHASALM